MLRTNLTSIAFQSTLQRVLTCQQPSSLAGKNIVVACWAINRRVGRCAFTLGKNQMSKGQWAFRPAALTRTIKAAEKAGKVVVGTKIDSVTGRFSS